MKKTLVLAVMILSFVAAQASAQASPTGASQQEKDEALMEAIVGDDVKAAEKAIADGANLEMKGLGGLNALAMAGMGGHLEIAKVILARGADVNARMRNQCKDTALLVALRGNKTEFVKLLLEKGADVNAANTRKATPLIVAACKADKETVELLIAKGADVNAKGSYWSQTALQRARAQKRDDIAKVLTAAGAKE